MISGQVVRPVEPRGFASDELRFAARQHPRLLTLLSLLGHLSPFAITGLAYELLSPLFSDPSRVHVRELWDAEARLFSVMTAEGPRPLSLLIAQHQRVWLDLICGTIYLLFLIQIVGLALYLFFRDRPRALQLSLGFLLVNVLGWLVWYAYPAAPPWYVEAHGFGPVLGHVASSPAGLARLDAWLGLPIAHTFYAQSTDVFGALPSLHVAYAALSVWAAAPLRSPLRWATVSYAIGLSFSALYLRHHYLVDVIAGVFLALLVASALSLLFQWARHARVRWQVRIARQPSRPFAPQQGEQP